MKKRKIEKRKDKVKPIAARLPKPEDGNRQRFEQLLGDAVLGVKKK